MGELVRFYQKGFDRGSAQRCILRVRKFPAQSTQYLEVEIPLERIPTPKTREWVEGVERGLREMFAPLKSSPLLVGIDNDVVYIHIFLDLDLDDDEITDYGICLKRFLNEERQIIVDTDYVTGDEPVTDQTH